MPYVVNNTRGQIIAVVQDGTVNTSATSQTLVGKNVTPYGEYEVENLVHQLENFANSTAPNNPIEGQLWYNTSEEQLYTFSGEEWKTTNGLTVSTTQPTLDPRVGNFWFNTDTQQLQIYTITETGFGWVPVSTVYVDTSAPAGVVAGELYFNSDTKQLFAYDGTEWNLIGPEGIAGFATTRWESATLPDTSLVLHAVMLGTVNGTIVSIVSTDTFTIAPGSAPTGFTSLVSGINMADGSILNGVANSAQKLATPRAINGVLFDGTASISINNTGTLSSSGYLVGNSYNGGDNATWSVNADTNNTPSSIVARNGSGDFSAGTIYANLVGTVTGTATNVSGIVMPNHGGTGQSTFNQGELLIGTSGGSLNRGTLSGDSSIQVSYTPSGLALTYVGGTGVGNVTSVGIDTVGEGIGISGSPITGAGSITVTNTGVTKLNPSTGISVSGSTGNVTITNTGVTSLTTASGSGIALSASSGGVTISNTGVKRIIAGTNIQIVPPTGVGDVTINADVSGGDYSLPTASSSVLGGVKVGSGLSISSGVLSTTGVEQIIPGPGVSVSPLNGKGVVTITANPGSYSLPIASGTTLGGVKIGAGLSINPTTGVLSATGGGGGGGVTQIVAGTGLSGGTITSSGTIAVDSTVLRSTVAQTKTALQTFTGGIISQAYNFSPEGYSIFYVSPSQGTGTANAVQVAVNNLYPNYFYQRRFVVEGSADYVAGERGQGGAVVGIDNGVGGGAGVLGWHSQAQPGLGIGVLGVASNTAFTGDVIQSSAHRATSSSFDFLQAYSYASTPGTAVSLYQLRGDGNGYAAGAWVSGGADYAEYFESDSGLELQVGTTVVLINNKIRNFQAGDDANDIIGVVRPKTNGVSAMIGNSAFNHWSKRYLTDDFGAYIMEPHMVYKWSEEGVNGNLDYHSYESHCVPANVTIPPHAEVLTHDSNGNLFQHPKENPDFDPMAEYVPRENRPEWHVIGLLGQVPVKKGQTMNPGWKKMKDISAQAELWYIR